MTVAATTISSMAPVPQRLVIIMAAWALLALIFTSNLIPIGTVFGIPFRMTLYVIVLAASTWLMVFARGPDLSAIAAYVAALLGVIVLAALNGLISGKTPDFFVLDDLRTYVVTFSIPMLALLNVEMRVVSARSIARVFVWGTLAYALAKTLFFWTLILFPQLALILTIFFLNDSHASVVFGFVSPGISRIQTGLDFSAIISLSMVLIDRDQIILRRGRSIAVAILSFAVLVTFSRALVALLVIVLFAYLAFVATRRIKIVGGALLSILMAAAIMLGATTLQNRLETGERGDQTRASQAEALLDLWEEAPIWGNGLGAFNSVVIRDKAAPYNYELQLHSIASKLGLGGIVTLIGLTIIAFAVSFGAIPLRVFGWPVGLFLAFLAAATTNPYMFSSAAANIYIALFIGFRAFDVARTKSSLSSATGCTI